MSSPIPPHSAHSSFRERTASSSFFTGPRLNLALKPSASLGPFRLGLSLWHTIDYLRSHQSLFPHINIAYDPESPRLSPIVVSVEPNLHLVFHGTTQRLILITLDGLAPTAGEIGAAHRPVTVVYNGRVIHAPAYAGSAPVVLTRSSLHQLLGPTYPGWTQSRSYPLPGETLFKATPSESQEFVLGYPGVAFAFVKRDPSTGAVKQDKNGREGDIGKYLRLWTWPPRHHPVSLPVDAQADAKVVAPPQSDKHQAVSTIYVFSGSDPAHPEEVILAPSSSAHPAAVHGLASPSSLRLRGTLSPTLHEPGASSLADTDRAALEPDAINIRAPCLLEALIEPHRGATLVFARTSGSRTPSPLPPAIGASTPASAASNGGGGGSGCWNHRVELLLGVTTPQDAMCDLGTPQRIFYKEDDRMRIHATGGTPRLSPDGRDGDAAEVEDREEPSQDDGSPFFYNYFDLGIDLLFSSDAAVASSTEAAHAAMATGQARLEKIICHTNVAGDALFQRYNRCPWKVVVSSGRSIHATSESGCVRLGHGDKGARTSGRPSKAQELAVPYCFSDDFREGTGRLPAMAHHGPTTAAAARLSSQSKGRNAATVSEAHERRQSGPLEGLSMELDRGTCAEFGGTDASQPRNDFGDLDGLSDHHHHHHHTGLGDAIGEGGRVRGASGAGGGLGERESQVQLDLSTELVGREGLVLEVGKDRSVVGVVAF
ncbi:hypothetical protein ACQY0O_005383 [Thecaphora frezii]